MHIPDGYLSPASAAIMYGAATPFWLVAVRKVRKVLNDRTVPLLAIFAALSFAIMMFNVPVPGGTTAHGVGGTLIAIVLGPWAAIIGVSTALIIQAFFFGDGGITAIGANCFNMAIVLPLVGYLSYVLIAGRSNIFSRRRVIAAAIGSYIGITVAALFVGIELGIQPIFWTSHGHAIYSPYGFKQAIPAMLLAHAFGASFVEAAITALGVSYLQKSRPEILLRRFRRGSLEAGAQPAGVSPWVVGAILAAVCLPIAFVAGLIKGSGQIDHLFGIDWTQVAWGDVGRLLLIVLAANVIVLPIAYFASPRRLRKLVTFLVGVALWTPIGLITPGLAYAEFVPSQSDTALPGAGYVPSGVQSLSHTYHALLPAYNFPWISPTASVSQQAIGYMVAGFIGMGLLMLLGTGLYLLVRRRYAGRLTEDASEAAAGPAYPTQRTRRRKQKPSFVEKTIGGIAGNIEQAIFSEEHARKDAFLQRIDPRVKLVAFLFLILAVSLALNPLMIAVLYVFILAAAIASRLPMDFYIKRVWLGIPLFAGIIVIPSIFLTGGHEVFRIPLGFMSWIATREGLTGAGIFVLRVGTSVSLAVLLILTTRWADVLKSLRVLRVPTVFVLVLSMTYRYVFLFLHTVTGMFQARKSRTIAVTSGGEQRRWIVASMGVLMSKSFRMSNDVYQAMLSRGFHGEMYSYDEYAMRAVDWLFLLATFALAAAAIYLDRWYLK